MSARRWWWVALALAGCAAPRIPIAPPVPPAAQSYKGPAIHVCVLPHQGYEADRADAVAGGSGKVIMEFATVVVFHPTHGVVVIDPSIGREKMKDFAANPWLMRRIIGDGAKANTLGDLLQWAGIEPEAVKLALVTHVHWDHISGAIDVPSARILMREPDLSWSDHAKIFFGPAVPPHEVARIRSRIQEFEAEGPAYEGFASSYDLFGDGSIVGVPTPGHTPGSTSWFVNSGDGRRWLFVGDAAWDHENVELPAHKGWKGRFADNDKEKTGETLALLHAFAKARPVKSPPDGIGVQVVPAHDASVLSTLPVCVR